MGDSVLILSIISIIFAHGLRFSVEVNKQDTARKSMVFLFKNSFLCTLAGRLTTFCPTKKRFASFVQPSAHPLARFYFTNLQDNLLKPFEYFGLGYLEYFTQCKLLLEVQHTLVKMVDQLQTGQISSVLLFPVPTCIIQQLIATCMTRPPDHRHTDVSTSLYLCQASK